MRNRVLKSVFMFLSISLNLEYFSGIFIPRDQTYRHIVLINFTIHGVMCSLICNVNIDADEQSITALAGTVLI